MREKENQESVVSWKPSKETVFRGRSGELHQPPPYGQIRGRLKAGH